MFYYILIFNPAGVEYIKKGPNLVLRQLGCSNSESDKFPPYALGIVSGTIDHPLSMSL